RWDHLVGSAEGVGDATLVLNGFPIIRGTYPFVPYVGIEPGLRLVGKSDRNVGFTTDVGALVPLTDSFAVGLSPMNFESYWSIDHHGDPDTALTGHVRIDAFWHDGFWFNVASPDRKSV